MKQNHCTWKKSLKTGEQCKTEHADGDQTDTRSAIRSGNPKMVSYRYWLPEI